jgi:Flp pilus assembly protein TadB
MTTTPNTTPERTLGQLVADATQDVSTIVRSEIDLAKAEITADAKQAGKGAGMFAGAGVMGFLGVVLILFAVVYGLVAAGLPVWLSFLIVAVLLFVVAGVLGLVGKKAVSKVKGKPERTIVTTQETIAAIKPNH